MRVNLEALKGLIHKKLAPHYGEDEIKRISEVMLFAELAGKKTHGILRLLPNRFGPLDEKKSGELKLTPMTSFSMRMEGQGYPGMLLSSYATDKVVECARENKIGIVSFIGNRSTCGSLTYFVNKIAQEGFIGVMMNNCSPIVAPMGISKRVMGTNPLAVALPNLSGDPLIVDFGTSQITFGELAVHLEKGSTLPPHSAIDASGQECRDPAKVVKEGALLPFGGHKGFGIALAIELICGPLMAASYSGLFEERGWGNLIIALDPKILGGDTAEMQVLFDHFLKVSNEGGGFRFPGTKALKNYRESLALQEVEVVDAIYNQLMAQ